MPSEVSRELHNAVATLEKRDLAAFGNISQSSEYAK